MDSLAFKAKRRAVNLKNMREWLKLNVFTHGKLKHLHRVEKFSPEEIMTVVKLFNKDAGALDSIVSYCLRFKKASGEISPDVIREAMDSASKDLLIFEVMES
jgi:hypothetical protein